MLRVGILVLAWATFSYAQNTTRECGEPIIELPETFVVGGNNAFPGLHPWQLAIEVEDGEDWNHHCGAVLIEPDWALTAARCVDGSETYRVVAGQYNRSDPDENRQYITLNAADITIHEDWDSEDPDFDDIALLRLDPPADGDNVNRICLPPSPDRIYEDNPNCAMTGWGLTIGGDDTSGANVLQASTSEVMRNTDCEFFYWGLGYLTENMVCGSDEVNGEAGSCNGDEGGPLMCVIDARFELVGISSFTDHTDEPCDTFMPTVYTRATSYLQWIEDNTNP